MTATPPRADLRTLATVAAHDVDCPDGPNCGDELTTDGRYGRYADAVLAAVLPEHRRMVLTEAADDVWAELRRIRLDARRRAAVSIEYINGWEDATGHLERLVAAASPAGLSAPVPAGNAPAVPEEADGQRAGQGDALTYAEMESERDRLARELYEAHAILGAVVAERDDAKDGARRAWLELEHWRTVIVPELMEQRDRLGTDRDRLAAQVAQCQRVVEAAKAWRYADSFRLAAQRAIDIRAAVDALSDAGTDQTEGET